MHFPNSVGEIISVQHVNGNSEIQIDLSNQPVGIYIVHAVCGKKIFREKIIKQ